MFERTQGSKTKNKPDSHIVIYENNLGGCALNGDGATYYPRMWKYIIDRFCIKSILDIGCGAGHSLEFFQHHDIDILGVEGCQEAIDKNLVDKKYLIKHDYENNIYRPEKVFDFCWSAEFVEHVNEDKRFNFFESFKMCKYLAMTFAGKGQGGHHHVNENTKEYWVQEITNIGFRFEPETTKELVELAKQDMEVHSPFYESHFIKRGLFFTNEKL
jgi:2-polyprenyl-3-methyl-5-hydroxy-6-metoxy-1,4-benzoquinol methylase